MSTFDPLSFFDNDVSPAAAAAATPAATPAVETPAAAPVAAQDGQVAAPAAEAKPEFEGAPAGFVPVAALQAERTKRQTLEDTIKASKTAPAATAAPVANPAPVPVPQIGTPEHAAYLQDMMVQTQIDGKFNLSEARFVSANGVEETKKLQDWVEGQDVFFFQRLLTSPDPYALAKVEYDRDQAATAYKGIDQTQFAEFQKYLADKAAGTLSTATPAVVAPSQVAAAQKEGLKPSVSSGTILTTPSASGVKPGETPAAPGAAFANIFN